MPRKKAQPAPEPTPPTYEAFDSSLLYLAAAQVDDLEGIRTATANRTRQLTRSVEDVDGEERGFGFEESDLEVASFIAVANGLKEIEESAIKNLQRTLRQHPLGPWVKKTVGVGEKQGARLLAAIGDPYIRPEMTLEDGTVVPSRPRTVSELWAYSGYSVIDGEAPRRRKGVVSNWSDEARMRAYLIAESCVKAKTSPYRKVYDDTRAKYASAVHEKECKRCGPAGKPALPGSDLSDGHKHKRAMRAISKTVLRDLWREAKRVHGAQAEEAAKAA